MVRVTWLQTEDVERALAQFVDVVIGRLRESEVGPTPLEQEWDEIAKVVLT